MVSISTVLLFLAFLETCLAEGCIFLRDDQSIRCQNTSLPDIGESLHILTMVVHNRPRTIDIEDCWGAELLPPIFEGVANTSIDTVRVRRSGLKALNAKVFLALEDSLRDLDLSHNALRSIPTAVGVLRVLEHLNLMHNRIVFLRPTGALDGLPFLRELNLAHNYIGQANDVADDFTQQHGYQLKAVLSLEDFHLGHTPGSLESLNLRGNRLAVLPRQLAGHAFPQLRHLDLSENVISKLDDDGLALMPKLEFLDLQSNRLQSLPFYSLPLSLQYLDLTENPFNCDCGAMWIFEWHTSNSTNIRLPSCNSPDHFKDVVLNRIPWSRLCPDDNSSASIRHGTKGVRDYELIQSSSSAKSISVSWKVLDPALGADHRRWALVYRRANDSPYQMTLVPTPPVPPGGKVVTQRISNLRPGTSYVACVAIVHEGKYTVEPSKCRKVTTKGKGESTEKDSDAPQANVLTGSDIHTDLDGLSVSATSVTIRWILRMRQPFIEDEDASIRHEWTIRIRRTGSDNYTDIPVYDITPVSETDGQLYEYAVPDLSPRTLYDVCLVDVEHRPIGDKSTAKPEEMLYRTVQDETSGCTTVQTSSHNLLYATEIAAITLACGILFVVTAVTLFLCRQKRLIRLDKWLKKKKDKKQLPKPEPPGCNRFATIPRVRCEPRTLQKSFLESWNSLRLPYTDFSNPERPEFKSFRTTGYRDALTSVTIYKSGFSEC